MKNSTSYDLVLKNAKAVLPDTWDQSSTNDRLPKIAAALAPVRLIQAQVHIGIRGGKISAISATPLQGENEIDCTGLHVLPGVIDSQVHFRDPGMTHKEDLETGTRAAALGGVTSIFEMPNTIPATTTKALFQEKLRRADAVAWVNYAFFVGGSPENVNELAELEKQPGCSGIKVFMGSSTGTLLVEDDSTLKKIFSSGSRRVILHSEDEPRLRERKHIATETADVQNHPIWRDVETAVKSTTRLLRLARETGRKVHVLHISTAEELEILKENRDIASCEVLPQHLTLAAPDCYMQLGTKAQQNPPIRDQRHRTALWNAVVEKRIDVMGSDHAPHTLEEKAQAYPKSPSGMPMVQTMVPLMLDHVNAGKLTLERFVELVGEGPRRVFGCLTKGRIAVGLDADFTLVDMKMEKTFRNEDIVSRAGWTPFDGHRVKGWPVRTIVGGRSVMVNACVLTRAGKPVEFTAL